MAWPRWCTSLLLTVTVVGCGPGFLGDGTTSSGETIGDGDFGDGDGDGDGDTGTTTAAPTRSVDVLFVVDNSGSMGEEQAALAIAADVLVAELEAANADYRIGVTTSDNGNPWCPSGATTPEAGNLVLSSCKVNGQEGVADADAVLHPLSRYVGLLDGLEQEKQALDPNRELIVALIGGVPSDGTPFYADVDGTDPVFQNSFGIGPGCEAINPNDPGSPIQAVPPVRMRDVSNTFSPGSLYSICDSDYASPMSAVAQKIVAQF